MRYENRYLAPNIDILSNTIRHSKEISLFTASKNAWKSRLSHFQLLSKSALTLSNHEPRSLWRWGSTRNRRINRFPATVLALLLYICLWRWKLAAPEQLSAWTIRHDHVIIAERIFSSWVAYNLSAQIAGGFPSLYEWERAPPVRPVLCEQNWMLSLSLPDITSVRYAVWTVGNINLHLWDGGRNKTLSEPQCSAEVCSVCACRASTFEITNPSVQKTRCERLFLRVGLRFYDERSRKVEKVLQVNFEMYQVYIISIYLSI